VNANNEPTDIVEQEDVVGLDHEDLNLSKVGIGSRNTSSRNSM
jgi:hypothetical protein